MKKYLILLFIPLLFGFTYPVDLDAKYVAYNTVTTELSDIRSWSRADGMEIVGLDPDLVILQVVDIPRPVYDPDTEKLVKSETIIVPAEQYKREWLIIPLLADELDEIAQQNDLEAEKQQAIVVYPALKNGDGTSEERLIRIERVLAHLLKKAYREL